MIGALARRLLVAPLLALGAATAIFLLVLAVPGDPAVERLGERASPADLDTLRHSMGLDRPAGERYLRFVGGLVRGDLGTSWHSGRPNGELLAERLPATLELAGAALAISLAVALAAALVSAAMRGSALDRAARTAASAGSALPSYAVGPVLILVFAVLLRWFPLAGRREAGSWVLPAVTLAIPLSAQLFRILRAGLDSELGRPWILAARARGVGTAGLVGKHALAGVAATATAVVGLQLGSLLTGALVTETLFSWPGVGRLLVEAIRRRDDPLVEAAVVLFALVYLATNLAVDLAAVALDPRAREGGR